VAIQLIERICRAVPQERRRSAKTFHDAVDFALVQHGWTVHREYPALPRGLIDLVVTAPLRIGIELDRFAPREKSLLKLREFDGLKVIVLRQGRGGRWHRGDVVVIECGNPRHASRA
jgi:hypothetical protein